jgi:YHS domain-containing protein
MKTPRTLFVAVLSLVLTATAIHAADKAQKDAAPAAAKDAKAKPYPLDFCLVSDEKFEGSGMTPFEMVQDGQTIKFCCKNCVKDFKKDPKKYAAKLAAEVKKRDGVKK